MVSIFPAGFRLVRGCFSKIVVSRVCGWCIQMSVNEMRKFENLWRGRVLILYVKFLLSWEECSVPLAAKF